MAYTGRLRLKGVPFFRLQVYDRERILLIEVYESVGLSVISLRKKVQRGLQIYCKAVKKSRKRSGFVIYSYFKCSAFTLVKRDAKFLISYKKGVLYHLSKEGIGKGYLFSQNGM